MKDAVKSHPINAQGSFAKIANNNVKQWLAPFMCLLLIEVITFGINVKNVGIYQDEWITLQLHFAPPSLTQLISICFWNPRIIVRPLEALHFGPLFYFVKENPLWYHITCYIWEFFGAWFLYLALHRFTRITTTAFIAALLYLLYPIHDVTHYEIVASSLTISMAFFTASLWLYIKGLDEQRFVLIGLSAFAYFLSIYNYELCLPLLALYPLFYLLRPRNALEVNQNKEKLNTLKTFIIFQIPSTLVFISMLVYRRLLLPNLGLGYNYAMIFNLSNFFSVLWAGWIVSFSPFTLQFFLSMLAQAISQGLSTLLLLLLTLAVCSLFFYFLKESHNEKANETIFTGNLFSLIIVGILSITFSYTIYGLSPEHKPVIDAWLNRVNLGGALGASMIIAAFFSLLKSHLTIIPQHFRQILFAALVSIFSGALILINWQFAKPWIVSWTAQKELIAFLRNHAHEIKSGDSIIIGHIIRYTSKWTPVVDGVWDFQAIVRTTLDNDKVNGAVVTERLTMTKDSLIDKYGNILLGTFPFKQMILCDPLKKCWTRISSRQKFAEYSKKLGWNIPESVSVN